MCEKNNPYYLRDKTVQLFAACDIPVHVIGKINSPSFIYNYKQVLNCYLQGCKIVFTRAGEVLFKVHLLKSNPKECLRIKDWFDASDHRECHRIKVQGKQLFLNGYYHSNGERVARFTAKGGKVYFDKKFALGVAEKNENTELKLEIT
jgi:hypothetical protein